jgi:multidrug resistance efflux pump
VQAVFVTAGQQVAAGDALLRFSGAEQREAAVEAARTALLAAEQAVKTLRDSAGQARADAFLRLAGAKKALEQAEMVRGYRQYRNGSDAMIEAARADVILANDALGHAQEAYNAVSGLGEDNVTKAGAISALAAAQKARDRAVANLNYLLAMPNQVDVDLAEAELQAARAEVDAAQRAYDALQNGPDPDALALAEQQARNAAAQLAAAEAALRDLALTAPFDATVAALEIDPGAWAAPGQPLLLLADLAHLQIQTTDLSERDVPQVAPGQPALIAIKALSIERTARVVEISPLAGTLGGDVVYTATLDLIDPAPAGLRPGMTVDVRFLVGEE